ncbi:nitroreductase family deazaflavin-dependent oxidoreductase [Rhodococcus artemisiae]|uniref:Nitroreductase family deazaflavin-dependent oxidoreductase n=1 Tax=Rhodococcus artemisiae TaxID=714159 RepID=A0ABU7LJ56_9NOCA|nr:nitroreductase family deazaflavin-dependent oxidoreductase [Rhodococcus artemisiae]MEE2061274.1 nitroreductase family deazaflavin-dependent oxidoreductase [Rhodococcus artemisiae]
MEQGDGTGTDRTRPPGTPGALSRWFQRTANARTMRKIRRGKGRTMGMDMLILHTIGRRSGQRRETPLMRLADGDDAVLVIASGGGSVNPDWHANLMAHPDGVSVELPGREPVSARAHELRGAEREQAWQRLAAEQPRIAKYQSKSDREYPLIRLTLQ